MKKIIILSLIVSISLFFIAAKFSLDDAKHKYIGTKSCTCHNMPAKGKQIESWSKTKHANAYKALLSDEANKVAKEKGFDKPAKEVAECLACHVTGYGKETADKYSMEEGITCEACHGPASDWKGLHTKKETLEKAVEAGLVMIKTTEPVDKEKPEGPFKVEEHCKTCHNEKSPTFKEFKFAEMWKAVAHPLPKVEKKD